MEKISSKLLYELNWNCRQTNSELAKKMNTSKQVIAYRIKKFEDENMIHGYSTIINWRKLGFNSTRIYLKLKNINGKREKEIYNYIIKNPLFMWSVKFGGEFDLAFYVWTKNVVNFYFEWNLFLKKYKKYILEYVIAESVVMINYPLKFLIEEKENIREKIIGIGEEEKIDKIDNKILEKLSFNAKIHIIDLAEHIGLTSNATINRIKSLEKKKIILGYSAILNMKNIGYLFYKIDIYLNDFSKINKMYDFAKNHQNVIYVMKTIGGADYQIEVAVKNILELDEIIKEIEDNFYEVIEFKKIHRLAKIIKQFYLPGQLIEKGKVVKKVKKHL